MAGIRQWTPFAHGLEAAQTSYQAYGWQAPRRLVVVREMIRERPEARGRKLLEVPGYTFHVLVTILSGSIGLLRTIASRVRVEGTPRAFSSRRSRPGIFSPARPPFRQCSRDRRT